MPPQDNQQSQKKCDKFRPGPLIAFVACVLLFGATCVVAYSEFSSGNNTIQYAALTSQKTVTDFEKIQGRAARVVSVVDGDTLVMAFENLQENQAAQKVHVRLIGVNTPESVDKRKPVQCFGKEASAHTAELVATAAPSGLVKIVPDSSQGEHDKYGRTLAYLYFPDGSMLNERIISDGYGYEYTYRTPYEHKKRFKEAEAAARAAGRGLWSAEACAGNL